MHAHSLARKLIMWFVVSTLVPILLLHPLFLLYQQHIIRLEVSRSALQANTQLSEQLNFIFSQINSISTLHFLDEDLNDILSNRVIYDKLQYEIDLAAVKSLKRRYDASIPEIDLQLTIIADDGRIYGNTSFNRETPITELKNRSWYEMLLQNPWKTHWIKDAYLDRLHNNPTGQYLYSIRPLKNLETWENHGFLILGFLESDIIKMFANSVSQYEDLYVLDNEKNIITTVLSTGNVYDAYIASSRFDLHAQSQFERIDGADVMVTYTTIPSPQWKLVTFTSPAPLLRQYQAFRFLLIISCFFFLLSPILFFFLISRFFVQPIQALARDMYLIGAGNLTHRTGLDSADEIGQLGKTFNDMLDHINGLMSNIEEEQSKKRSAEIQALYTQINPHFMYNTLASIRYLVQVKDVATVDSALLSFIAILRNTVSDPAQFCTLNREISILMHYIDLQQLSFDPPFQLILNIPRSLHNTEVIKLILQPVVENAILHGLKPSHKSKKLLIRAAKVGDELVIRVWDNGVGTDKQLSFSDHTFEFSEHIGLQNIHSRIIMYFGSGCGVTFYSKPGMGSLTTIRMPYRERKEDCM